MNAKAFRLASTAIADEARKLGGRAEVFFKDHHPAFALYDGPAFVGTRVFGAGDKTDNNASLVRQDVRRLWRANH